MRFSHVIVITRFVLVIEENCIHTIKHDYTVGIDYTPFTWIFQWLSVKPWTPEEHLKICDVQLAFSDALSWNIHTSMHQYHPFILSGCIPIWWWLKQIERHQHMTWLRLCIATDMNCGGVPLRYPTTAGWPLSWVSSQATGVAAVYSFPLRTSMRTDIDILRIPYVEWKDVAGNRFNMLQ